MTVREQTQQREEQSLSSRAVLSGEPKAGSGRKRKIRSVLRFRETGTVSSTASPSGG